MTANLEKQFFNWILRNPNHFRIVMGFYFENEDIRFVYDVIRNEYMSSEDKQVPSSKEIISLVQLKDKAGRIPDEFIKALLKFNPDDYREEYITTRFNAWVLYYSATNGLMESYEDVKNIDKTDINAVKAAISRIRENMDEGLNVQVNKSSLGLDFDDPDAHDQDTEHNKITSGFACFDTITEGGFDRKTFNVWMGAPGAGKSLTLQNIAVNAVNAGYNVAYISLELSEKKCMKRIGSMRLEIPISEYTELAKDRAYMKERIEFINKRNSDSLFDARPGKLFVKEYPSGSATISDIEMYVKQVREEAGVDIDMLIIDYIQIMGCEKGVDRNMLYLKGEHLAVGLRAIAQRHNLACITATQIAKDKYGANDMSLNDMPESKAIADTADSVWGIILTPQMKLDSVYHWKWLKLRDCSSDYARIRFQFNKQFLKLHSDEYMASDVI